MSTINKILSNFNSNQFYKLNSSDLDLKTIDKAINKGVSLTNDVNNVLKYNHDFLIKYIRKFGNTRFINEAELIDFKKFSIDDIEDILRTMYGYSKTCFIKTLNKYPQFIELVDFKYCILSKNEINELNDAIFNHYRFDEIPEELLKDNKELIKKYLNTDYLFDIYKDLINYSNELRNDILNKAIENIRNDKTLLNRLSKDDIKLMLTHDISLGKDLLDYFYENNKDVSILKDYFINNADYDYYYLMQNFEKTLESSNIHPYFYSNYFNNEQQINIIKKYLNLDSFDDEFLATYLSIIKENDALSNMLFNAYIHKKIKNESLIIYLCHKFPEKMIETDKNNLYEYLKSSFDSETYNNIFNKYISKLTREELIDHKDVLNIFIAKSLHFGGEFMNKLFELDILDLINYDNFQNIFTFIKNNDKNYIIKMLKLTTFENCQFKKMIIDELKTNNLDIDSILPNYEYDYNLDLLGREKIIDILNKIKEKNIDCNIKLIMNRVDKDFINEASNILPGKIKIAPLSHQENSKELYPLNYEIKEILEKDKTLDIWAKSITATKEDVNGSLRGLSPFEIAVACYKVTTHFKTYTLTNESAYSYSRSIYEFINNPNPEICCVGYSNLFMELLNRCGINTCCEWGVRCKEGKDLVDNHSRVMLYLDDPKYGINGIYMCDPTHDSILSDNTNNDSYRRQSFEHFLMDREKAESETYLFSRKEDLRYDWEQRYKNLNIPTISDNEVSSLTRKPIDKNKLLLALSTIDMFVTRGMKMPATLEVGKEDGIPQTIYDEVCADNYIKVNFDKNGIKDLIAKSSLNELLSEKNNNLENQKSAEALGYIENSICNKLSAYDKNNIIKNILITKRNITLEIPGNYSDMQFDILVSIYGRKIRSNTEGGLFIRLDASNLDFDKKYSELEQDILEYINSFVKEFKQLPLNTNTFQEINLENGNNIAKK